MPFSLAYRSLWSQVRKGFGGGAALTLMASCSLVVETDVDQCSTDDDCAKKGTAFAGTHCSAKRICVSEGSGEGCQSNADCPEGEGEKKICRKSDNQCVSLLSNECKQVDPNYRDDSAILLGSIEPLSGGSASTGASILNSITLARTQIEQFNGLPALADNLPSRSLAFVHCDDAGDREVGARAAAHLVTTVKVPAIIGAAFSGVTNEVARVTIPGNTLLISPSATSASITSLSDKGLVWRTAPSDDIQARALARLLAYLEPLVRDRFKLGDDAAAKPLRVAVINKGDSYGSPLAASLEGDIRFNNNKTVTENGNNYIAFNYGDTNDPKAVTDVPGAVTKLTNPSNLPHVIFLIGSEESVSGVFKPTESTWPAGQPRPFYIFADAGALKETAQAITDLMASITEAADLRTRVVGTVPGANSKQFDAFRLLYNKTPFPNSAGASPDTFGAAGAYDSTFLLAYAIASQGTNALTGPSIAEGLKRLVAPSGTTVPLISAGGADLAAGIAQLAQGQNINYDGASGPLDFDVNTGDAVSDIQYWCVPTGETTPRYSGAVYSDSNKGQTQPITSPELLISACK